EHFIYGDPTLVSMFVHNLIENASKYRSAERKLVVRFGLKNINGVESFYISDNGIGFEQGFSERIFKPFERLHRYADIPGTGIGLSNVKRIVERHGGQIWASSDGPEKGATIFFTLGQAAAPQHVIVEDLAAAA